MATITFTNLGESKVEYPDSKDSAECTEDCNCIGDCKSGSYQKKRIPYRGRDSVKIHGRNTRKKQNATELRGQ